MHLLESFVDLWFSTKQSTKPMMRGTVNESTVLKALKNKPFNLDLWECDMQGFKGLH